MLPRPELHLKSLVERIILLERGYTIILGRTDFDIPSWMAFIKKGTHTTVGDFEKCLKHHIEFFKKGSRDTLKEAAYEHINVQRALEDLEYIEDITPPRAH